MNSGFVQFRPTAARFPTGSHRRATSPTGVPSDRWAASRQLTLNQACRPGVSRSRSRSTDTSRMDGMVSQARRSAGPWANRCHRSRWNSYSSVFVAG
jgi:transcription initiation factor TFIID subunit TAF12